MRIVQVTKDHPEMGLVAGKSYVMAESDESSLPAAIGGVSAPLETYPKHVQYKGQDLTGKRLLIYRGGGIGDTFFYTPLLQYLKRAYPDCFIRVCTGAPAPLIANNDIDEIYGIPWDAQLMDDSDYCLGFQGLIESGSPASRRTHAVDLHFLRAGIDPTDIPIADKIPVLRFFADELDWAREECLKLGVTKEHKVVGISCGTSMSRRDFPLDKLRVVIEALLEDPTVLIVALGSYHQTVQAQFLKHGSDRVIEATKYDVRQALVLAARFNLAISSDTFLVQVMGAMHRPVIGLYGPFPSRLRMGYFKNAVGIDARTPCSPCCSHDPRDCLLGFPSPCYSVIPTELIIKHAKNFLGS